MNTVDEFLEHYGTRGMKWGVRKKSSPRPAFMPPVKGSSTNRPKWQSSPPNKNVAPPASVPKATLTSRFSKKKTPKIISEEAQQFREIRSKAKKDGVQSLTNKDLELVNKRIELQAKYNKAFPKKKNPFIEVALEGILSDFATQPILKYMGDKKVSPVMITVVKAAIELNKQSRKSTTSKK